MPKSLILLLLLLMSICWNKVVAQKTDSIDQSKRKEIRALIQQMRKADTHSQWQTVVDSAQKAIAIDSSLYAREMFYWPLIGVSRYKTGDYQGAINDLARYTNKKGEELWVMKAAVGFKIKAHLALGQLVQAAQTFELFDKNYGPKSYGLQMAAIFYKGAGDKKKFNDLMTAAIKRCKYHLDSVNMRSPGTENVTEYAELLIISGKTAKAANVLKQDSAKYTTNWLIIKNYLLGVTTILKNNNNSLELKDQLKELVKHRLWWINVWDFEMFDTWLTYSGLSKAKQQELLELQDIAEIKYK